MPFRVLPDGTVEVDTAEEVQQLQQILRAPIPSRVASKNGAAGRLPRGASPGSLEGRILAVLREHDGGISPRALTTEAKAPAYAVRKAVKQLAARGVVRADGTTGNRTIALVKKPGRR